MISVSVTEAERERWGGVYPTLPESCFVSLHVFRGLWNVVIFLDKEQYNDAMKRNKIDFRPYGGLLHTHLEIQSIAARELHQKLSLPVINDETGEEVCNPVFTVSTPPRVRGGVRRPGI